MSLKIEFRCSCGKGLYKVSGSYVWDIEVAPCERCLENAYKEGSKEGYNKGYYEGYNQSYEEGRCNETTK
ncbi:MAG: hypothetical protein DDT41_01819 [candidate division WS2 bacterium]|nr:hypothetical protein [Candidatus Psychracetigena formicireducens]